MPLFYAVRHSFFAERQSAATSQSRSRSRNGKIQRSSERSLGLAWREMLHRASVQGLGHCFKLKHLTHKIHEGWVTVTVYLQKHTGMNKPRQKPHPQSAPGPFYVVHHECAACGMPHAVAPELFGCAESDSSHCIWKKQPQTTLELEFAVRVMESQDLGRHRYCGDDPSTPSDIASLRNANLRLLYSQDPVA